MNTTTERSETSSQNKNEKASEITEIKSPSWKTLFMPFTHHCLQMAPALIQTRTPSSAEAPWGDEDKQPFYKAASRRRCCIIDESANPPDSCQTSERQVAEARMLPDLCGVMKPQHPQWLVPTRPTHDLRPVTFSIRTIASRV